MPLEPSTASLLLSAIGISYQLFRRSIDHRNATVAELKVRAKELKEDCEKWAVLMHTTFDDIRTLWIRSTLPDAQTSVIQVEEAMRARLEVLRQDNREIDYDRLVDTSPVIQALRNRGEFAAFAESCVGFYRFALHLKEVVHTQLQYDHSAPPDSDHNLDQEVDAWKARVNVMLSEVRNRYYEVEAIRIG